MWCAVVTSEGEVLRSWKLARLVLLFLYENTELFYAILAAFGARLSRFLRRGLSGFYGEGTVFEGPSLEQ